MKNRQQDELWITNINRFQDISIGDLNLTVRRGVSINLLAKKKNGLSLYNLTRNQIDNSINNGSIFKKRDFIKVRKVSPEFIINKFEISPILDISSIRNFRKPQEIENVEFPDLDLEEGSAEEFAVESADMDMADRAPVLAVDPIFKHHHDDE